MWGELAGLPPWVGVSCIVLAVYAVGLQQIGSVAELGAIITFTAMLRQFFPAVMAAAQWSTSVSMTMPSLIGLRKILDQPDPSAGRTGPEGIPSRSRYPSGQIPLTSLDRIALAVQNYLPLPNNTNAALLTNNYNVPSYTSFKHTTNPSVKIDHSISPLIKISGYVSRQLTFQPNNNGLNPVFTGVAPVNDRSSELRSDPEADIAAARRHRLSLHLSSRCTAAL
jgi:hypothetical protein